MKAIKYILATLSLVVAANVLADELNSEQLAFRSSVMQFLKEEGFSPYIDDSDNTLTFKKEGTLYWIDLNETNPFYVEFHRSGLNTEDADGTAVILAASDVTKKTKCVKALVGESSVSIAIEMFCHSAEEFKYIFYRSIKELDKAASQLKSAYAEWEQSSSAPITYVSAEVANAKSDGSIATDYGMTIYAYKSMYLQPRITLDIKTAGSYDIFIKMYNADGNLTTGSNSPSGYSYKYKINATTGTHTYELTGWGSETPGHWKAGNYRFEFYYDGELLGTKYFTVK